MSKNSPVCPTHKPNPKRTAAKMKRGFGELARKQANLDKDEWSKKHDPMFKIKGKERHNKSHS